MIRYIDFIDFISSVIQDDFSRRHDIVVEIDRLLRLTDGIEEELPSVRIDIDDDAISHFGRIDKKGITITEREIRIRRNSDGYTIVKRAYEINRKRESMKCIIKTIKNNDKK